MKNINCEEQTKHQKNFFFLFQKNIPGLMFLGWRHEGKSTEGVLFNAVEECLVGGQGQSGRLPRELKVKVRHV